MKLHAGILNWQFWDLWEDFWVSLSVLNNLYQLLYPGGW